MPWKAAPADDPFDEVEAVIGRARLSVVEPSARRRSFLSQLGVGWTVALCAMAVGAVLAAAFVYQPMMSLR
ncbi:MAG TPA: hypothetical protein VMU14_01405 [Acidimicrobiales bacterium]|nr:hypothetical protein [Acidimicrobiales bacterium]